MSVGFGDRLVGWLLVLVGLLLLLLLLLLSLLLLLLLLSLVGGWRYGLFLIHISDPTRLRRISYAVFCSIQIILCHVR